jgi:hypothetical protein
MEDFLLDCCFSAVYEGLKFRESTPRYANRLRAMLHSAESTHIRDISAKSKPNSKIF